MNTKNQEQFISKENKKRILLGVNALLMVVLIVVATYAWFSRNTVDDVNVDEIAFQGSSDLEVSLTGKEDDYAYSQTMKFSSSSLAQDISGDGSSAFYIPTTKSKDDNGTLLVPDTNDAVNWTPINDASNGGKYYKTQTIYFRSTDPLTVSLGDGSAVLGAAENSGAKLVGKEDTEVGNKSTVTGVKNSDGERVFVSKDCIVGASRIAFLDSGTSALQFVWIPRPNIFYETKKDAEGNEVKTIYGGTSSTSANLVDSLDTTQAYPSPTTHYFCSSGSVEKLDSGSVVTGSPNKELLTLTRASVSDRYYKGSIKVVIWVEGCDAEARRAFAGGKFGALLRFVGAEPSGS